MKWTIVFLVGLGILAAISVVMLVNAFRFDSSIRSGKGEIAVVLAAADLPAWTVLKAEDVMLGKINKNEAPGGVFGNTALVVGKVLSVDMVEGQMLTGSQILAAGGPADIAALLSPGMRAVSVTLSNDQISGGLLYPRCFVDVLASFKLGGMRDGGKGEALATTLLERVKVLAIAGESMLTTPDKDGKSSARSSSQRLTITLELDTKQAEALQLAVNNGSISLALRNPLDTEAVDPQPTVLDRGKLSRLGELMGVSPKSNPSGTVSFDGQSPSTGGGQSPNWDVMVIRGRKVDDVQLKTE